MSKIIFVISILFFLSCATYREEDILTIRDDAFSQVSKFGDLCAESSVGYEDMAPSDAYFEGVKCASQTIIWGVDNILGRKLNDDDFEGYK